MFASASHHLDMANKNTKAADKSRSAMKNPELATFESQSTRHDSFQQEDAASLDDEPDEHNYQELPVQHEAHHLGPVRKPLAKKPKRKFAQL